MSASFERERKFLVRETAFLAGYPSIRIIQGYLVIRPDVQLRIRVTPGGGQVLTIKSARSGIERFEQELVLKRREEAHALLEETDGRIVVKDRYAVDIKAADGEIDHWTVDEYFGDNQGLFIAEYEYPPGRTSGRMLPLPRWIGAEVTSDNRYYASNLSVCPYKDW